MSWVTVIWSMIAAACLTVSAIYFVVWCRNRSAWAHLWFSMAAASTAAYAFCELAVLKSTTPAELALALRWAQLMYFFLFVTLTWFVHVYLRAGRRSLAWSITGLRFFYLLLTFLFGISVNLLAIPELKRTPFLGEPVTVLAGTPNPLTLFGQSIVLLILFFVVDAGRTAWRRGDRRQAVMVAGSVAFFLVTGLVSASIPLWGQVPVPVVVSWCYMGLVAVMGLELSRDVLRASQLLNDLQRNQAELQESQARMSLAAEAGELGIWIWTLHGNQIWASERCRSLFGYSASEALDFEDILLRLQADDREALRQAHVMALAGANGGRYQMDYRLELPDKSTRWIGSTGLVEFDAEGRPLLIRGTAQEVTLRKKSELETQVMRQELAHAGRVSMVGYLASGLAHELHQPLASILRNTEAAELFLEHPDPDLGEIREILSEIRQDDERAALVIDRMRGLLKPQASAAQSLTVDTVVRDVARLVRVDAAARQIDLRIDVAEPLPLVRGDRVQLQQVLLNLVLNAMDALHEARPEKRCVQVLASPGASQTVEISVVDEGTGIAPDKLPHVFDPFFTTKPQGMGMGLAISRNIIEMHGGRLWAENKAGGGAIFRIVLPALPGAAT